MFVKTTPSAGRQVTIYFEGQPLEVEEGISVAAAVLGELQAVAAAPALVGAGILLHGRIHSCQGYAAVLSTNHGTFGAARIAG